MQRVLSTYLYVAHELTPAVLEEIARAGVPAVEIFCARPHFDYRSAEKVRKIADWFENRPVRLHALHAPTSREFSAGREGAVPISVADTERVRRLDAVDEMKHTLDVAEKIPFRFLVLHLGGGRELADPRKYDAAMSSLEHLVVFAKQRGVTIALENTPSELAAPSNLRHFLQDSRLPDLRLCFDTGHAHLEDGVEASFALMREWVVTAHLHDNHGERDEHLLPFQGTIDWAAARRALAQAPAADGGLPFVLELKEHPGQGSLLEQVSAAWQRLEELPVS